jgi:uncharacterized membrane-anchored protein
MSIWLASILEKSRMPLRISRSDEAERWIVFESFRCRAVSSVRSKRAEIFYWFAILCSNTLGTALGDYLADEEQGPGLGFMGGAVLIGATIAVIAAIYLLARKLKVANVGLYVAIFWAAFVLTRPFGATFGDVLARGHDEGGLGFGPGGSSAVLAAILVGVMLFTSRRVAGKLPTPRPPEPE